MTLYSASIALDVEGVLSIHVRANAGKVHVVYSETDRQRAAHLTPRQLLDALLDNPDISWSVTREGPRR